jgi:hypothetical protein
MLIPDRCHRPPADGDQARRKSPAAASALSSHFDLIAQRFVFMRVPEEERVHGPLNYQQNGFHGSWFAP